MNCISTHAEFICFFCDPFPFCALYSSFMFILFSLLKSECDDWTLGTSPRPAKSAKAPLTVEQVEGMKEEDSWVSVTDER